MRGRARRLVGVAVGVAVVLGVCQPARAEERAVCPVCHQANDDAASYPSKAGNTLVRGTANTLLGWTELIRQPAAEVKSGGNVFTGMAKGVGQGVKRTLGGVGEILTFWTPRMKGSYLHFNQDCPLCAGKH